MGDPIRLSILGSTGSIGKNTLDLVRNSEPGTFEIIALSANKNADLLADQAKEFGAKFVALATEGHGDQLKSNLSGTDVKIGLGRSAVIDAGAMDADFIMASIIGAAGLEPTLAAIDQGARIGLANKESLVCAGEYVLERVRKSGAQLLPVDSEHNAIFQVLEQKHPCGVSRLILTASGGPFFKSDKAILADVKAEDALKHPIWSMGAKITIDSATMMNKGLELIEASYLFGRSSQEIDVVIHPQSIVHSMVEYIDGSVLAQMGTPDMRTPIAHVMAWPKRMKAPVERLDLTKLSGLTFFQPDDDKFPALNIARQALTAGGQATNILNAANEIAVDAFLNDRIRFTDISAVSESVLDDMSDTFSTEQSLETILALDAKARGTATELIQRLSMA